MSQFISEPKRVTVTTTVYEYDKNGRVIKQIVTTETKSSNYNYSVSMGSYG